MASTAEKTDPALWERIKDQVTAGDKGGHPGEWSARKAQMAVARYKKEGGGYKGGKDPHNHLAEWTGEHWDTGSGKPSGETGERYLPEAARAKLSDAEYRRTTAKKRADTAKGHQHSAQPADIARKTAQHGADDTKAALLERARAKAIPGRSRMTKAQLVHALAHHD